MKLQNYLKKTYRKTSLQQYRHFLLETENPVIKKKKERNRKETDKGHSIKHKATAQEKQSSQENEEINLRNGAKYVQTTCEQEEIPTMSLKTFRRKKSNQKNE